MLDEFFRCSEENQNVVPVHKHKSVEHVTEYCRSIGEAKRHRQALKMCQGCVECSLPLAPLPNTDQVVGISEVLFVKKKKKIMAW